MHYLSTHPHPHHCLKPLSRWPALMLTPTTTLTLPERRQQGQVAPAPQVVLLPRQGPRKQVPLFAANAKTRACSTEDTGAGRGEAVVRGRVGG